MRLVRQSLRHGFVALGGLLAAALGVAACLVTIDDSRLAATADAGAAEASAPSGSGAPVDAGRAEPDAGDAAVAKSCPAQVIDWTQDAAPCQGTMTGPLAGGATIKLFDHEPRETGTITLECNDGVLATRDPICTKPVKIATNATTCSGARCIAFVDCGTDPGQPTRVTAAETAAQLCRANGYESWTDKEHGGETGQVRACWPDGSQCIDITADLTDCIKLFSSVTCRY